MSEVLHVAIVHYHLRPGGVTQVIRNAADSLSGRPFRCAILAGGPPSFGSPVAACIRVVESLNYSPDAATCTPEALVERMEKAAVEALGREPDLWHIHNHSIGKNPSFSMAAALLAQRNKRLLLQIHDFPEDGRPDNYRALLRHVGGGDPAALGARLYPQGGRVHYAVLNARDREFMARAGVDASRLHLLPNPVNVPGGSAPPAPAGALPGRRLFLYPTRAIRRKNVGEFLLWAAAGGDDDRFACTLAPTSPADLASYERWVGVARELRLPVEFEAGRNGRASFAALLQSAHAVVTTSIGEGFGLVFLEPWLFDRPLVGRNLPEMTAGFKREGLRLDGLYERLLVPLDWAGGDVFRRKIEEGLTRMLAGYGRGTTADAVDRAWRVAVAGDAVDFGRLDEELQERVIRRAVKERKCPAHLRPAQLTPGAYRTESLKENARLTRERYGLGAYADRLAAIYWAVASAGVGGASALRSERLLDEFLAPERFFLLRT